LPVVWVPSPTIRAHRKLLRGRAYLVRWRTSVKNRIHGHLLRTMLLGRGVRRGA